MGVLGLAGLEETAGLNASFIENRRGKATNVLLIFF